MKKAFRKALALSLALVLAISFSIPALAEGSDGIPDMGAAIIEENDGLQGKDNAEAKDAQLLESQPNQPVLTLFAADAEVTGQGSGMSGPVPTVYNSTYDGIEYIGANSSITYTVPDDFTSGTYDVYLDVGKSWMAGSNPFRISVNDGEATVPNIPFGAVDNFMEASSYFVFTKHLVLEDLQVEPGDTFTIKVNGTPTAIPNVRNLYLYEPGVVPEDSSQPPEPSELDFLKAKFKDGIGPAAGSGDQTYSIDYTYYDPVRSDSDNTKYPLMIWLHGAWQGFYPRSPLDGSEVALFASDGYQAQFGNGAYIMVPRAQEDRNIYWMTESNGEPVLLGALLAAIDDFIANNPNVDTNRIYIGGFSMGGYMTWKTVLERPDFFAAAFPICPAYRPNAEEIASLGTLPIWIIHGVQDPTCNFEVFSQGLVQEFDEAGNNNVWLSAIPTLYEKDGVTQTQTQHHAWVAVTNNMLYENGEPYDPDYPDGFIPWLAAQKKDSEYVEVSFDIETACFDYGQLVTKLHIKLEEPLSEEVSEQDVAEAFSVIVANYNRNFYGMVISGDFPREITKASISEDRKTIVLELKSLYADSLIGGANYAMFSDGYVVTLTKDLGNLSKSKFKAVYSGVSFDPEADKWHAVEETSTTYNYRYFDPSEHGYAKPENGFPIVVWLHGGGETGSSNNYDNNIQLTANRVTAWGQAEAQDLFGGAFVIAPQTSRSVSSWTANGVIATIEAFIDMVGESKVDRNRIYIGGCSMGGMGTWTVIKAYPDYFAAAFPICANTTFNQAQIAALKDLPIYLIHSVDDTTVNISGSINAYNTLKAAGKENIYLAFYEHVVFEGLGEDELGPGHWSWVYVHNDFDGEGDDEVYWLDEYTTGGRTYETTKPSELGFSSFKAWLAGQSKTSNAEFDIETTCFDFGQLVTKLHIRLDEAIVGAASDDAVNAFEVIVKNYNRNFYGFIIQGDFNREIVSADISEDGKTITLGLKSTYEDSLFGAANYAMFSDGYAIILKRDLGNYKAGGIVAVYSGKATDPEADKWKAVEETTNTYNYRYFDPSEHGYEKPEKGYPIIVWLHGAGESGSSNNYDNNIQITANRVTAWGQAATQDLFGGAYVIAPQTSRYVSNWTANGVIATIEAFIDLVGEENVDRDRIYIGGCSMGGMGTWTVIKAYPDYFAAAFPICASTSFTNAQIEALKDLPIFLIHSVDDNTVNISGTINAYNALTAAGKENVYLALYEHVWFETLPDTIEAMSGYGHWSWVYVHNDFDGEGADEKYWLDEYIFNNETYYTTKPSDLDYSSFKAWLADQVNNADEDDRLNARYSVTFSNTTLIVVEGDAGNITETVTVIYPDRIKNEDFKVPFESAFFYTVPSGSGIKFTLSGSVANAGYKADDFKFIGWTTSPYYFYGWGSLLDTDEVLLTGDLTLIPVFALKQGGDTPSDPPYTPPSGGTTDDTEDEGQDTGDQEVPDVPEFIDIDNHWAKDYIITVVRKGLFKGTSNFTFSPDLTTTRAMVVTVLGRLAGIDPDEYEGSAEFADLTEDWYSGFVAWAAANGIVTGRSSTIFDPDAPITREELVVMIYRFLRYAGIELEEQDVEEFADFSEVSNWAQEAVTYLHRAGLINGRPGNIFDPKATATRAETAKIFAILLELIGG